MKKCLLTICSMALSFATFAQSFYPVPLYAWKSLSVSYSQTTLDFPMVMELLDFTRMQDGRMTLVVEPTDILAEFEDAVYTYRELFKQEGIELTYDGGDDLFTPISGDPERLKQVFCNVLDNAAKHGGSGKRIDAAIRGDEAWIYITVRDYGSGIPENELPFVKQKFYKGSSKARGSGIGLAVVEEIVRLHGGTFDIGNAEGGGCIVTIAIPR